MDIKITPNKLKGNMEVPPSKSYSHRGLIAAYLGGGAAIGVGESADTRATRECLERMKKGLPLYANESGSTLRFMIPIALAVNKKVEISGSDRLMERPLDDYFKIFDEKGISYKKEGNTLFAEGSLKGGVYRLRGNVSSQFITGLLFALPLIEEDSEIEITTHLESKSYVDMTLDVLEKFGVKILCEENLYKIKGGQKYLNKTYSVEGDFSQAAFFLAMGDIALSGLDEKSIQGDKEIVDVYRRMGMEISYEDGVYKTNGVAKRNIEVDVSQIPDCVPALASVMAVTEGEGRLVNAARLRIKESDRLRAVTDVLTNLGADVFEGEDYLIIKGKKNLSGGVCKSHNDHRIVMAIASISDRCTDDVVILGADAVNKSMPDFWDRFERLGGKINELNMG